MRWRILLLAGFACCLDGMMAAPSGQASTAGATRRAAESLDRGLVALSAGEGPVYVAWRLLASDPPGVAFNVYRRVAGGEAMKLNAEPIRTTTDFADTAAVAATGGQKAIYVVRPVGPDGAEGAACDPVEIVPAAKGRPWVSFPLRGAYTFQKAGIADLTGDGKLDWVIKQPDENIDPWYLYWKKSPSRQRML